MEAVDGLQATAWVREFETELSPQAKRRLERDPDISQLIVRAIQRGWLPKPLAEHVSHAIGWQQPENARDLMIWRLKRASGETDEGKTNDEAGI